MAEIEANGTQVGGLAEPHRKEGLIREQNARRLARRRQAAALAFDVQRVTGENLSREGEQRKVGGRFEKLQKVPKRKRPDRGGLSLQDLGAFMSAFNFGPQEQVLSQNQFLSSFGPFILGLNNSGA
jgi:hypothetical protein